MKHSRYENKFEYVPEDGNNDTGFESCVACGDCVPVALFEEKGETFYLCAPCAASDAHKKYIDGVPLSFLVGMMRALLEEYAQCKK